MDDMSAGDESPRNGRSPVASSYSKRGDSARFPSEARQTVCVEREGRRKNLQRDITIQFRVARAEDLAHGAGVGCVRRQQPFHLLPQHLVVASRRDQKRMALVGWALHSGLKQRFHPGPVSVVRDPTS
jgi:hypothetical protein